MMYCPVEVMMGIDIRTALWMANVILTRLDDVFLEKIYHDIALGTYDE